jgi:hypothetical protein
VLAGGLLIAGGGLVAQAAKPPNVTYWPATASFRDVADRIQSDGLGPYIGNATSRVGAFLVTYRLSTLNDFTIWLDPSLGSRAINLDLGAGVPNSNNCGSQCRLDFNQVSVTSTPFNGMLVRPVDGDGNPTDGGMQAMGVGETSNAHMLLNFPDPSGRSLIWTVRFNPPGYPGSCALEVTRDSSTQWTVETNPACDLAKLVASPDGSVRRQTDEGLFHMPFQLTVTYPIPIP